MLEAVQKQLEPPPIQSIVLKWEQNLLDWIETKFAHDRGTIFKSNAFGNFFRS